MAYQTGPSENTLTVNNTHQMLSHFEKSGPGGFRHLVAFSPSRQWEKLRGYDIKLPTAKSAVYQYKRPKIPEKGSVKSAQRRFSINQDQWETLTDLFDPGQAFFALPITLDEQRLPDCLDRTVFVDVHGILPNTSLVYASSNGAGGGTVNDFLVGKINNGRKYPIVPSYVYGWIDLSRGIDDCSIGLRISSDRQRTKSYQNFTDRVDFVHKLNEEMMESRKMDVMEEQETVYSEFFEVLAGEDKQHGPGKFYDLGPGDSATWSDVEALIPSDPSAVQSTVRSLIDREWVSLQIADRVERFQDTNRDLSTFRIKRSQINVFGR